MGNEATDNPGRALSSSARSLSAMVKAVLPDSLSALIAVRTYRGWRAWALALGAVVACVLFRTALEPLGRFYYLPMVPGVIIAAVLAGRAPTAFAIVLSIAANVWLVPREGMTDIVANAGLFAVVTWLVSEVCWAQKRLQVRTLELSRDSSLLDTVLATVPVVILDRAGRVRRMTEAAGALFGRSSAEVVGCAFGDLVHGFTREHLEARASERPLEAPTGLWIGRRPDGAPLLIGLQVGVLPQVEGPNDDYAAVCLTDRTDAETAMERARELDEQLNSVWRLNSLGEIAATLAHELNQPLSAATTYVHSSRRDIEKAGPLGDSAARTLDMAKTQMIRAGAIIRRMRDMLDPGAGHLDPERISSMIDDLGQAFALIARERGVEIRTNVDPRDDGVRAERIQFQQAMINLVRNAVDAAADRPTPLILVTGGAVDAGRYRVTVEDNGPGISSERLEDIFRPMHTTKASGMGLGLSVTRKIVERHGGALTVGRSELGGAAFAIDLPLDREAA